MKLRLPASILGRISGCIAFVGALILPASPSASAADKQAVHLILLSGQSNMDNLDPDVVLIPELEKHFGAVNVVVVKVAQKGQPIRRWFKGWKVTGDQNPDQIGDFYERLIKEAKAALGARSINSATLVWMQAA